MADGGSSRDAPPEGGDWLPPEPSGPEPDLGKEGEAPAGEPSGREPAGQPPPQHPASHPPPAPQPSPAPQSPPAAPPPGWGAPQQSWPPQQGFPGWQGQQGAQQPPPGWQPQAGWQQPPPGGYPPPYQGYPPPPGWSSYAAPDTGPGNGEAIAGLSLSASALALLIFTAGFSSIVSIVCAALGIVFGRKGRKKVDSGQTRKHRGMAQAGFVLGIAALVLAVIATAGWTLFFIFADLDDLDENQDFEGDAIRASVRLATLALRVVIGWA